MRIRRVAIAVSFLVFMVCALAQTKPAVLNSEQAATYLLGPDDQLTVRVADVEEITDKTVRISTAGMIVLPMVGRVHAAGLTVEQLEAELVDRLSKYVKEPEVSVTRIEMRSQPVSIIGSVKSPGVHQLQGRKTLVEILSLAGGLSEDAGYSAEITRRREWGRIPLPNAADDPSGEFSIAEVPIRDLMLAKNPAENILVMPNDVISIPKAEMVYVIGEVGKTGGIILGGQQGVTVLQAVSIAGGLNRSAKPKDAKILRLDAGSAKRQEVPIDLKALLAGKIDDIPMKPDDILFVPNNSSHNVAVKALEAALQVGTGVAIISARP